MNLKLCTLFKTCKSAFCVLLIACCTGLAVQSQQGGTAKQPSPKDPSKQSPGHQSGEQVTVRGTLTAKSGNVLAITDTANAEHRITVTETTKVTKGGKGASSADLKVNDRVMIEATKDTKGALTAINIAVEGE